MHTVWLGVDVGGTFTDIALVVDGDLTTAKVPTTDDQSVGVRSGIETACDAAGIDPVAVDRFRHGTTVAVNALLEGEGAETALVTTDGFADVLEIGRQDRPALYDLDARKPTPLVDRENRYTISERATVESIEQSVDRVPQRRADVDRDHVGRHEFVDLHRSTCGIIPHSLSGESATD